MIFELGIYWYDMRVGNTMIWMTTLKNKKVRYSRRWVNIKCQQAMILYDILSFLPSISLGISLPRTPSISSISFCFNPWNLVKSISDNLSWKSRISGKSPGARLYFFITVRNTAGSVSINCCTGIYFKWYAASFDIKYKYSYKDEYRSK